MNDLPLLLFEVAEALRNRDTVATEKWWTGPYDESAEFIDVCRESDPDVSDSEIRRFGWSLTNMQGLHSAVDRLELELPTINPVPELVAGIGAAAAILSIEQARTLMAGYQFDAVRRTARIVRTLDDLWTVAGPALWRGIGMIEACQKPNVSTAAEWSDLVPKLRVREVFGGVAYRTLKDSAELRERGILLHDPSPNGKGRFVRIDRSRLTEPEKSVIDAIVADELARNERRSLRKKSAKSANRAKRSTSAANV